MKRSLTPAGYRNMPDHLQDETRALCKVNRVVFEDVFLIQHDDETGTLDFYYYKTKPDGLRYIDPNDPTQPAQGVKSVVYGNEPPRPLANRPPKRS